VNDDGRDPLDETLARGLGALAPSEFELDADRALGAMRPALRRARTRRRVAASTSALGLLVVFAAGAAVVQHRGSSHVNVLSHTPTTHSTPAPPRRTPTTHAPDMTTSTTDASGIAPRPDRGHTPTSGRVSHTTVPQPAPTTTSPAPPNTVRQPGPEPGSTSTTVVSAPSTRTYFAIGGRVKITFAKGRLTLDSYAPTPGYTTEVHTDTASEIEVRFTNDTDNHSSRIRVRVQNGGLEPEIKED